MQVQKVREVLHRLEKPSGMYPNYVNTHAASWGTPHASVGALGDSFYEYLLKEWLRTAKGDVLASEMFQESQRGVINNMVRVTSSGLTYVAEWKQHSLEHKMDHLGAPSFLLSFILFYYTQFNVLI